MKTDWPPLSEFVATVGKLATEDDTRANRAVFLLQSDGVRIGRPIDMPLPCYAWFSERGAEERKRCVILQAESVDEKQYYGAWLIDDEKQAIGTPTEFEIIQK